MSFRLSSRVSFFSREKKDSERALLISEPTFARVLIVPTALHFFSKFLVTELSEENIEFYHSVNMFVKNTENLSSELVPSVLEQCNRVVSTYFGSNASRQINVNDICEKEVRTANSISEPMKKIAEMKRCLLKAQAEILKLMSTDAFPRFLRSSFWTEFLSAQDTFRRCTRNHVVHIVNGDLYEGEMLNEKIHGHGTYTYHNGDVYSGTFVDGQMHGVGEFTTKVSRLRFVGEFVENVKQGKGVMYFPNEDRVEGVWVNNKLHGQGICYDHSGKAYDAFWQEGQLKDKVEKTPQRMMATFAYTDADRHVITRPVYCQSSLEGINLGWKADSPCPMDPTTKTLSWKLFQQVAMDLKRPQLSLHFASEEKDKTDLRLIIQPCNPYDVSTQLLQQIHFLETVHDCSHVSLVRSRFLFARMKAGFRHRREKTDKLLELDNEIRTLVTELKRERDRGLIERKAALELEESMIRDGAVPEWQFEVRVPQLMRDVQQLRESRDIANLKKNKYSGTDEAKQTLIKNTLAQIEELNVRASKLLEFEETSSCAPEVSKKYSTVADFMNFRDSACPIPMGTPQAIPDSSPVSPHTFNRSLSSPFGSRASQSALESSMTSQGDDDPSMRSMPYLEETREESDEESSIPTPSYVMVFD